MDRQKGKEPEDPRSRTSPAFQRLEVRVGGGQGTGGGAGEPTTRMDRQNRTLI